MKSHIPVIALVMACNSLCAQDLSVTNLRTDLIEDTESIFVDGFESNLGIGDYDFSNPGLQVAKISTRNPSFSWAVNSKYNGFLQNHYRIIVSSSLENASNALGDMWDSGMVDSPLSSGVRYEGKHLLPNHIYYWRVLVVDKKGIQSQYSEPKAFVTADAFDESVSVLPLHKYVQKPVTVVNNGGVLFADWGKAAFGQLAFKLQNQLSDDFVFHIGEVASGNTVNRNPGGSRRYKRLSAYTNTGQSYYPFAMPHDSRNTSDSENESNVVPILMPQYVGEVFPFRYCEVNAQASSLRNISLERLTVNYPFDDNESYFNCSDEVLNSIYDLCKHSMKATSFCGYFVDGDRERIPYEADIYINMLSYYAVSSNYSIARRTIEHIINYPTWPTEWILYTNLLVYYDYLFTGDNSLIINYYEDLRNKTLNFMRNSDNGLISTGNKITDQSTKRKVHFKGSNIRDIVDWPHHSASNPGEDDGFNYKPVNTVVNMLYYKSLLAFSQMAAAVGFMGDEVYFDNLAKITRESINSRLMNRGVYVDGLGSSHTALHSQMFGLALGVANKSDYNSIATLIVQKGMVCSVYGAQFFLDAVYEAGLGEYGYKVLSNRGMRSFYNMIKSGSTITTEAWDNSLKDNQDWSHAWGAAAGNIIVRKLMGIEPLAPGFARFRVAPQPGSIESASVKVPTVKGPIEMSFSNKGSFSLKITVPANTEAVVLLPGSEKEIVLGSGTHKL